MSTTEVAPKEKDSIPKDGSATAVPKEKGGIPKDDILLGEITMGQRAGQKMCLNMVDVKRHQMVVGGSGSGKTWALKVCAEGLIARGIPVLAIDQMGDMTGLAIPTGNAIDYDKCGLKLPHPAPVASDWAIASQVATLMRSRCHTRVLTPCSAAGEQVAILPLTGRPKNYEQFLVKDKDELVLQADAQVGNFLARIGFKINRSAGAPPSHELGVATEVLLRCWDEDVPLNGPDGMQIFGKALLGSSDPALGDEAHKKIEKGLASITLGAQALWFEGMALDFDRLLRAPAGKTPLIVVSINHISAADRPWVIGQIVHAAANWCAAQGASPERPRLGLFVDELAGDGGANIIMPPGNIRAHPSGEALRRVLRQGRHWGLSFFGGTQSPGDIDYKSFSNFGTRIVGKLSTATDVEKCIYGLDGRTEKLSDFIARAAPGRLFVIPPSGEWECVKMRMLGTAHTTIQKAEFDKFYRNGIWRRYSGQEGVSDTELFAREVAGLVERYRGKVAPHSLELLQEAAHIATSPAAALETTSRKSTSPVAAMAG